MMNPSLTPNFIPFPNCPTCKNNKNIKQMKSDFFRCTECGSMFQDHSYAQKVSEVRKCPECGIETDEDNWQLYYASLHFETGTKKQRGNFHELCWIQYYQRVEHEEAVFNNDVTGAEIASQVECPQCHRKSIYTYPDDSENRSKWLGYIYQCMDCGYHYPPEQMLAIIKQVKERRANANENTTMPKVP